VGAAAEKAGDAASDAAATIAKTRVRGMRILSDLNYKESAAPTEDAIAFFVAWN
jgi:hypothetical protein